MIVVGAHPLANPSMRRYTELLADSYRRIDGECVVIQPSTQLSRRVPLRLRKWTRYLEQIPVAIKVGWLSRTRPLHLADHSDAVYLAWGRRDHATVTCHDLIAVSAARGELEEHRVKVAGRIYQKWVLRGLLNAGKVVSVSKTTADEVKRLTGRSSPVLLNPLAPSLVAAKPATAPSLPSVLVVSTTGWRKRRWRAVEVWLALRAVIGSRLPLIVIGTPLDARERAILASSEDAHAKDDIRVRTGLSDIDLADAYANASLLVQMSHYEGFAWPIIEANFFGTVALCADEPILRETGEGNLFLDADTVSSLSSESVKVLWDASQDMTRRARVRARASEYTVARFDDRLRELTSAKVSRP